MIVKKKQQLEVQITKPLSGLRILVCGKGGSGKSSIVTLMAKILQDKNYSILLLDGDASNPGGLSRLAFGLNNGPKPLIEFFGGREKVICPVDDPAPLTRNDDYWPISEKHIDLAEISPDFYVQKENIILLQVGKIQKAYEGCDGPMSKVTRDFIVDGDYVTLIDVEAGIEHFGRGIEQNVDIVLVIVDPTVESFSIAERATKLCQLMGIEKVRAVLNKVPSPKVESIMLKELDARKVKAIGKVNYYQEIYEAGLDGTTIRPCIAEEDIRQIMCRLENAS
jgi:CO dehydrogenase maturation factor